MRGLPEDHDIIMKPTDKGSCVVVWDWEDFLAEADRQLQDNDIYKSSSFKDAVSVKLVEKSNRFFQSLNLRRIITEEKLSISLINKIGSPCFGRRNYSRRSKSV